MSEEKLNEVVNEEETVSEGNTANDIMGSILHNDDDPVVSVKKLLEAGVHFGHQTRKWNPKMQEFIFTKKNGIHIIDLTITAKKLQEAYLALKKIVADGGKVLFVGTKPQIKDIIKEEALRSGSFYAVNRWLGGTLTNFKTIQKRIRYLNDLISMEEDGSIETYSKKDIVKLRKEKEKLLKNLEGIAEMRKVPNAVIVVDPKLEHNAVDEAKKLNIPVFGLLDTNADPAELTYGVPANDDGVKSVQLICGVLADAIVEAKGGSLMYAYNVASEDELSMQDALNSVDKVEELKTNVGEKWQSIKDTVSQKTDELKSNVSEKWTQLKDGVGKTVSALLRPCGTGVDAPHRLPGKTRRQDQRAGPAVSSGEARILQSAYPGLLSRRDGEDRASRGLRRAAVDLRFPAELPPFQLERPSARRRVDHAALSSSRGKSRPERGRGIARKPDLSG